ncbi:MAG: hypothetical protein EHM87_23085 [Burkholderiales bacterium]|nr:MAG: hypothetical protein EHM87_23085 [Burkholderiales bacterium]
MHTHHSNAVLDSALRSASLDEALAITRTLPDRENATAPIEPARALELILFAGGNAVMNRVRGHGVGWLEMVRGAATALGVDARHVRHPAVAELVRIDDAARSTPPDAQQARLLRAQVIGFESACLAALLGHLEPGMTAASWKQYQRRLATERSAAASGFARLTGPVAVGTGMALASAGVFAAYGPGTTLGANASTYSTASALLGVMLGPVGWAALAAWTLQRASQPDAQRTVRIVCQVAMARQRAFADGTSNRCEPIHFESSVP